MKEKFTLLDLSNKLTQLGYPDIFNYALEDDILNLDNMTGSLADCEGNNIVEFEILEIGNSIDNNFGFRDHLDTVVALDLDDVADIKGKL